MSATVTGAAAPRARLRRSDAEICAELFLSEGTVTSHVASVPAEPRVRDRSQAVVQAYEPGYLEP